MFRRDDWMPGIVSLPLGSRLRRGSKSIIERDDYLETVCTIKNFLSFGKVELGIIGNWLLRINHEQFFIRS